MLLRDFRPSAISHAPSPPAPSLALSIPHPRDTRLGRAARDFRVALGLVHVDRHPDLIGHEHRHELLLADGAMAAGDAVDAAGGAPLGAQFVDQTLLIIGWDDAQPAGRADAGLLLIFGGGAARDEGRQTNQAKRGGLQGRLLHARVMPGS